MRGSRIIDLFPSRRLSRDPFTNVGWTIPEFRSMGLAASQEFHGISVDENNVFKIDDEAAGLLFQYAPKRIDMFPGDLAADD
jgi:hypothetical protein